MSTVSREDFYKMFEGDSAEAQLRREQLKKFLVTQHVPIGGKQAPLKDAEAIPHKDPGRIKIWFEHKPTAKGGAGGGKVQVPLKDRLDQNSDLRSAFESIMQVGWNVDHVSLGPMFRFPVSGGIDPNALIPSVSAPASISPTPPTAMPDIPVERELYPPGSAQPPPVTPSEVTTVAQGQGLGRRAVNAAGRGLLATARGLGNFGYDTVDAVIGGGAGLIASGARHAYNYASRPSTPTIEPGGDADGQQYHTPPPNASQVMVERRLREELAITRQHLADAQLRADAFKKEHDRVIDIVKQKDIAHETMRKTYHDEYAKWYAKQPKVVDKETSRTPAKLPSTATSTDPPSPPPPKHDSGTSAMSPKGKHSGTSTTPKDKADAMTAMSPTVEKSPPPDIMPPKKLKKAKVSDTVEESPEPAKPDESPKSRKAQRAEKREKAKSLDEDPDVGKTWKSESKAMEVRAMSEATKEVESDVLKIHTKVEVKDQVKYNPLRNREQIEKVKGLFSDPHSKEGKDIADGAIRSNAKTRVMTPVQKFDAFSNGGNFDWAINKKMKFVDIDPARKFDRFSKKGIF